MHELKTTSDPSSSAPLHRRIFLGSVTAAAAASLIR